MVACLVSVLTAGMFSPLALAAEDAVVVTTKAQLAELRNEGQITI